MAPPRWRSPSLPPAKTVQVYSFAHAVMDSAELERSDLCIVGASEAEACRDMRTLWTTRRQTVRCACWKCNNKGGHP